MSTKTITIVVPFLNEQENLPVLCEALGAAVEGQPESFEFLFVDDGSTDEGPDWLLQQKEKDPRFRLVRLSRNFGHQFAISGGLDLARGDAVVIIDADMQDPPEKIVDLLAKWREGFDVVYAVRQKREGEGFFKKLLAASFYRVFRAASSLNVPVDSGDFRLLDRKVVDALKQMRETHRYVRAMTSWVGFKQCAVEYDRQARHAGRTKYPVWKSFRLAWDGLTSFSGAPLRWVSGLGLLTCVAGFIYLVRILVIKIIDPSSQVIGWASVMAVVLFLGGIQLLSLGVLGQYMSRTFEESKKRPLYLVAYDSGRE